MPVGIGRADQDISIGDGLVPVVEVDSHAADLGRKLCRPLVGAVGNHRAPNAARLEAAGCPLADFSRTQQEDAQMSQVAENLLGQLHGDRPDGGRPACDLCLCPHALGHAESVLEEFVHGAGGRAGFAGDRVSLLHLTKDLGLADHHGV